ncbi:transglycosylase domain-containing protein [Parabacteroides sp. Marseille-P3160]|uniref:transglycosylase domain-containing protein n=1 Tax=Parabacteroides sp. Marseille-P3160 TaxID=1917887 RepID=UPI0009BA9135|nr:transglycosylase domain-containing protein [Parabacteroides sp. Marseille-P3160]
MEKDTVQQIISQGKRLLSVLKAIINKWITQYKSYYKRSKWYKKIAILFVTFLAAIFIYLIMVDLNFLWLFGKSPGLSVVNAPVQNVASELYSADGQLLGKYYRENRTPVKFEEISPVLIKTLIATEDERYYNHFGIDIQGLFAAFKDMLRGNARGASTITQQLAKNMFKVRSQYSTGVLGIIPGISLLIMKSKEWILALKLEAFYDKNEILTMYFNTVDFGSNTYGIKTACSYYFNTTPSKITVEQAATLVGLLKATTTYSPRLNPKNSLARRNVVLANLVRKRILTPLEYDSLKQIPIILDTNNAMVDTLALYLKSEVAEVLKEWCETNNMDLYGDGLKIYSTIDSRMQHYAELAVDKQMRVVQRNFDNHWGKQAPWRDENGQEIPGFIEDLAKRTTTYKHLQERFPHQPDSIDYYLNEPHRLKVFDYDLGTRDTTLSTMDSIRYMERFMHTGFVAIEPHTGYVKAWVGDVGFGSWQYDKVTAKRQPGSTFKLFVYSAAFNRGMSPCETRVDQYIDWEVMDKGKLVRWAPHNADGVYTGDTMYLKAAFARSINTIAVQLAKEIGVDSIIQTAYAMGIKTKLNATPSVSLGASDVSLLELVDSYCTVINDGMQQDPVLVTRIEDKDGKVLYEHKPSAKQAVPYETAFLMTELLRAGLSEPGGTTRALWSFNLFNYDTDFGGKTGTSSNHSDAWFVGVTPKLVGGAWVGGEHRSVHFRTGMLGQGSRTALPIFGYFMEQVLADKSLSSYRGRFPKPKQPISREYQCQTPEPIEADTLEMDSLSLDEGLELLKVEGSKKDEQFVR